MLYFASIEHFEGFKNTVRGAREFLTGDVTRKFVIYRRVRCEAMRCGAHSVAWGDVANGSEALCSRRFGRKEAKWGG